MRGSIYNRYWFGRIDMESPADPCFGVEFAPTLTDQSARPLSALVEDMIASGVTPNPIEEFKGDAFESLYGDELPEVTQRIYEHDKEMAKRESEIKVQNDEKALLDKVLGKNGSDAVESKNSSGN